MALIEWTKEMSVGLAELDEDHRTLIRIINDLADQQSNGDAKSLQTTFERLKHYAEFHFAREESVMRAAGYNVVQNHQGEHRAFEGKMRALSQRLEENPQTAIGEINRDLLEYLKKWLQHHILVIDMDYKGTVSQNPQAIRAAKEFKASHLLWS